MLPLPADLPSVPERALTKVHIGEISTKTTRYKNRRYRGKAHDCLPKPQESPEPQEPPEPSEPPETSELCELPKLPEDSIFIQDQKVAKKRPDANCVFLLWGSGNSGNSENSGKFTAWAVDVPITDAESEHEIFALLAKQYATRLGFLRRCLSFQKFSRLRPVTFRFISRSSKRFLALAEPSDLDKHRKIFSKRQEEAMEVIRPITDFDPDDPGHCYRDNSSGEYEHCNGACPFNTSKSHSVPKCPFEEWEFCNDLVKWIEEEPFLSSYFRDPAGARSQNIPICFFGHCFIHKYK
ncbi:unnamed protein product [Alternaria alternata]